MASGREGNWQAYPPRALISRRNRLFITASLASFLGYVLLLLFVRANPRPKGDLAATLRFQRNDNPLLARTMGWVSWFGFRPQSLLLPFSAVFWCWWRGRRLASFFLMVAWGGSLVSYLTKLVIRRPRPDDPLIRVVAADIRDTSFPSGHTLHYVTFWGFFSYIVATEVRGRVLGRIFAVVSGVLIGLVGPSRVYLGHHWLTDVLASYLLGFAYFTGLITVYRWLRSLLELDDVSA